MLQDLSSNKLGGTEEYTLAFGRALQARGVALVVAVRAMEPTWRAALEAQGSGIEIVRPGLSRRRFNLALTRLVRRVRPTVTVMNFFAPIHAVPLVLWAAGARRIIFVDDLSGGANFRSRLRAAAARAVARRCMAPVARIIGVSDFVSRRDHERYGLPRRKIHTVYNGVHPRQPEASEVDALRAELNLGTGPVVLGLGHFIQPKGFDHLVDAFAKCVEDHPSATLVMVGAKPVGARAYSDSLRARLGRLPVENVRLFEVRSDARTFMAVSDIVVVPSLWEEAFGFVVAEGMMAGAAVIASRTGGIPEIIEDGVDGLLVQRGSTTDLTEKLGRVLADQSLRRSLGDRAAVSARARFSVERMVEEMVGHVAAVSRGEIR